ncbi:MAG: NADH-quinone oxidoreductase subunit NuoE [Anaerolineae bacterium]|nr:NADH-quinone oxidoreductase subunit NuoE [Anaerolineae bacterium]
MLTNELRSQIQKLMARYPEPRSAVMPALHLVQRELGWLPDEAIQDIADVIGMSKTEVNSVAMFYTMYAREPRGKHTIMFCTDLPCALNGADEMLEHLEHKLGCKAGQTSPDGKITLQEAKCLGGCHRAPVMLVDGVEHVENLTLDKLDKIIEQLRNT